MSTKEKLLTDFAEWLNFVEQIKHLEWEQPLDEGKWSIHDVVSHIYLWDKYFLEEAIIPISNEGPLTLMHLNFDEFNRKAVEVGKTLTKQELISLTNQYRNLILNEIRNHDLPKFTNEYMDKDGNKFIVEAFLKDFIWHDHHHMKQIEERKSKMQRTDAHKSSREL